MSATPGPWKARINNFNRWEILGGAGQLASISTPWDPDSPPTDWNECEANARLISSAPDLLAALADLVQTLEFIGHKYSSLDAARAAIAKATTHD